jgi:hypothetical protein
VGSELCISDSATSATSFFLLGPLESSHYVKNYVKIVNAIKIPQHCAKDSPQR